MSEIGLQRPGVVAPIGQRKTAGVPEHVRVRLESHRQRELRGQRRCRFRRNLNDPSSS
jgi:hypothetical protein